jgi:uncharacterized protein
MKRKIKIYFSSFIFTVIVSSIFGSLFLIFGSWHTAFIAASLMFLLFVYGTVHGVGHIAIRKTKIYFPDLPKDFEGYRIVQISDLHVGTFINGRVIRKSAKLIHQIDPDLLVFTGDLVNMVSNETDVFMDDLKKLRSRGGVYSIFGNHDYDQYALWMNHEDKIKDHEALIGIHKKLGWHLLINQHVMLKRGDSEIALIGVENWGRRFSKYADMEKAMAGVPEDAFKILLSHDPTHWRAKILPQYKNISLTLSGHTHGGQIGIYTKKFKWSPAVFVYKDWAGLYTEGLQHLYVNVGLGCIGFPGRIGMRPEVAILELHRK